MRFVLFDRIIQLEKGREAVLLKNVSQSEDFFIDHFPGYPVVPGSIILGSFEQGAEILLAVTHDFSLRPVLQKVSRASFRHFVVPGDQIEIHLLLGGSSLAQIEATALVREKKVANARLDFALMPLDNDPQGLEACSRLKNLYDLLVSHPMNKAWDLWEKQ